MASNDGQYLMHVASFCYFQHGMPLLQSWRISMVGQWQGITRVHRQLDKDFRVFTSESIRLHHSLLDGCANHGTTQVNASQKPYTWLGRNLSFISEFPPRETGTTRRLADPWSTSCDATVSLWVVPRPQAWCKALAESDASTGYSYDTTTMAC